MNNKLTSTYTEEELENIILKHNIKLEFRKEFINKYKIAYAEFFEDTKEYNDDDWIDALPIKEEALNFALKYFKTFNKQLHLGHSKKWSRLYAESSEEEEVRIYELYHLFCETDKNSAKKELEIIAKNIKNEQHVIDYYLNIFETGDGYLISKEKTKKYVEIYDKQIKNNKSKIFANRYADLMAKGSFIELYCFHFTSKYEELILKNKPEDYAYNYSEKYAELLVNEILRLKVYGKDINLIIDMIEEKMKNEL